MSNFSLSREPGEFLLNNHFLIILQHILSYYGLSNISAVWLYQQASWLIGSAPFLWTWLSVRQLVCLLFQTAGWSVCLSVVNSLKGETFHFHVPIGVIVLNSPHLYLWLFSTQRPTNIVFKGPGWPSSPGPGELPKWGGPGQGLQRYYGFWIECETNVFTLSSVFMVLILLFAGVDLRCNCYMSCIMFILLYNIISFIVINFNVDQFEILTRDFTMFSLKIR